MYLKSIAIENFRKFGDQDNVVYFVSGDKQIDKDKDKVAAATTLIVGKNNAGKTTVVKALEFVLSSSDVKSTDFNLIYLNRIFEKYKKSYNDDSFDGLKTYPTLKFSVSVGVEEKLSSTIISNLSDLIDISFATDDKNSAVECITTYEIKETAVFNDDVKKIIEKSNNKETKETFDPFKKFLALLDKTKFSKRYYRKNGDTVSGGFKLTDLIDLKFISANKHLDGQGLSSMFNRIITRKCNPQKQTVLLDAFSDKIDTLNHQLADEISQHKPDVNGVLECIESTKHLKVELSPDISLDNILSQLIKYEYDEDGTLVPEEQFGLGYANLMHIIGQVIDYIDQYPEQEMQSKVNLICIEEPEAFMHPQMQENFINNIDKAVAHLLGENTKNINSQLIITTHSPHVLYSKIHSTNSFNNINYISENNHAPKVIQLTDSKIKKALSINNSKKPEELLSFLKKHIKFKSSELFFADAAIIVEGVTEDILLRYYLEDTPLSKFHITIFPIDGAHGLVYHPLLELLEIPALVVTDFDLKRSEEEKGETNADTYKQIDDLKNRTTTNQTLQSFLATEKVENMPPQYTNQRMRCVFQREAINGFYATSFEEAFILTNYSNDILNSALKSVKPQIYANIVGKEGEEEFDNLKDNSFKFQKKLSNSKSGLASTLLFEMITAKSPLPIIPSYISDGFEWLSIQLGAKGE